jgi:hypothetical protein
MNSEPPGFGSPGLVNPEGSFGTLPEEQMRQSQQSPVPSQL